MQIAKHCGMASPCLFEILELALRDQLERTSSMNGVVDLDQTVERLPGQEQTAGLACLDEPGLGLLIVTEELLAPRIASVHDSHYPEGVRGCRMQRAYHSRTGNVAPLRADRLPWRKVSGALSSFTWLLSAALTLAPTVRAQTSADAERVEYETSDGLHVAALLYRPAAPSSEAVVLFLREGGANHEGAVLARHLSNLGSWVLVPDPVATRVPDAGRPISPDTRDARDGAAALGFLRERVGEATSPVLIGVQRGANTAARARLAAGPGPIVLFDPPGGLVGLLPGSSAAPGPVLLLAGRGDLAAREVAQSIWKLRPNETHLWLLDGGKGIVQTMLSRPDFVEDLAAWVANARAGTPS